MPGPRVSQFEQTASGLLGISKQQEQRYLPAWSTSKTPDGKAIGGPHRRSSNGASLLFRRGATSTWVHPRSSSPVSSSSFQLQLSRLLLLFAQTAAAACSASGVSCTSPGFLRCPPNNTPLEWCQQKLLLTVSSLFFLEENGKLLNFFVGLAVSWSHLQSIELGRQTHGLAGCEELRVLAKKQAGPGQARRRLVAHPDTRGRVAVAWPPVANLGQ